MKMTDLFGLRPSLFRDKLHRPFHLCLQMKKGKLLPAAADSGPCWPPRMGVAVARIPRKWKLRKLFLIRFQKIRK